MSTETPTDSILSNKDKIHEIPLVQVEPDKDQLRKEFREDELEALTESIRNEGQIQPIIITKGKGAKYKIKEKDEQSNVNRQTRKSP